MDSDQEWYVSRYINLASGKVMFEDTTSVSIRCKFCGAKSVVRYGHYRQVQRWWCKNCQRKFVDNAALPGMRTPTVQVASALSMFYNGMSFIYYLTRLRQNLAGY